MHWQEVKQVYPKQWLIIEALQAHTEADKHRHVDDLAVIEPCVDAKNALQKYRLLHQLYPEREFYFVHTSREALDIEERQWLGIRNK